ncbi:virion protein [Human alphaherpesvirus 3]|uniref:Protein UL24 homolog n=2 Tax=Human herpesvirus 3 TaxID=10335 RepID=UL24_VZVD|nr:nuclear protein UL24 [Human alphaherpesvirus 3]P09288.1 RecName: Full=Protein UL24 homolog [Human herpesvirus 3 strain Dumas]AAT07717.1 virion protein [Human alphaherpesvirus 3]AAT07793.1 virion protein [Human alphaherpesvirus 3]ABF21536.1 unknown [Human alphaherpesvirus 3]ABF21609.1 unknown [Human alphaherpesvirus 3]ABF21901.1 unknown [Human alphaherpesvirus 3]
MSASRIRAKCFRLGQRCHTRFYDVLKKDIDNVRRGFADAFNPRLAKLLSPLSHVDVQRAVRISMSFEVNLGRRRPDCVCIIQTESSGAGKTVCFIVELKSCRFSANIHTPTKYHQFCEGMRQLRDTMALIKETTPTGSDEIMVTPLLVFVSQRGLNLLQVTRLPPKVIHGNLVMLASHLENVAEYTPPIRSVRERRRLCKKKIHVCSLAKKRAKSCHRSALTKFEENAACGVDLPLRRPSLGACGGILQSITGMFSHG